MNVILKGDSWKSVLLCHWNKSHKWWTFGLSAYWHLAVIGRGILVEHIQVKGMMVSAIVIPFYFLDLFIPLVHFPLSLSFQDNGHTWILLKSKKEESYKIRKLLGYSMVLLLVQWIFIIHLVSHNSALCSSLDSIPGSLACLFNSRRFPHLLIHGYQQAQGHSNESFVFQTSSFQSPYCSSSPIVSR